MNHNSPHLDAPFKNECTGRVEKIQDATQEQAALLDIKSQLNRMEQDIRKLDERTWTDKDQAIAQMRDYIKRCSYILFAVAYSETEALNENNVRVANELKNEYREKFA